MTFILRTHLEKSAHFVLNQIVFVFLEDPVIDICRNSQVLVHGYGHIVYWPSQKTNSSCVCHFHEATSVTVKAFSPLHKRKRFTCSSSIYINNENVPCETDGLKRQSANKITLTAPGNDRLWAEIQGMFS